MLMVVKVCKSICCLLLLCSDQQLYNLPAAAVQSWSVYLLTNVTGCRRMNKQASIFKTAAMNLTPHLDLPAMMRMGHSMAAVTSRSQMLRVKRWIQMKKMYKMRNCNSGTPWQHLSVLPLDLKSRTLMQNEYVYILTVGGNTFGLSSTVHASSTLSVDMVRGFQLTAAYTKFVAYSGECI